jgi:HEAT repeat protein
MSCVLAALLALTAAWAAPAAAEPEAEPDWLGLARRLDSGKKKERLAAVQEAAALGRERAAAYLRPLLTGNEDREVRLDVVRALRTVPGEDAVALLGEGLADDDPRVRKAVVETLRRRPEGSAVAQLARALPDHKAELRAAAALALGSRLEAGRAALLLGGLDDRDASVREATLYALGAVGGETAVEALSGVVAGDYNKKTKALAAEVLSTMDSRSALPALVAALDGADQEVLRPALEIAIKKILAQTPARVKGEESAPREAPRPTAEPAAAAKPTPPKPAPTAAVVVDLTEAKAKTPPGRFQLKAPQARSVLLAADFLAGKRKVMVRSVDGTWSVSLLLAPGSYRYQFIVDGQRTLDPANPAVARGASVLKVP